MKKLALTAIAASILALPAMASETQYFIGGGLGGQFMNLEATDHEAGYESYKWHDESASEISGHIRAGAIFNDVHRVTLTANFTGNGELSKDSYAGDWGSETLTQELQQSEILVSYDYLYGLTDTVSLFAGATAGLVKNEYKLSATWFDSEDGETGGESEKVSDTSFSAGLQVGAQYLINENWSTDLTYRHMFKSMDKKVHYTSDSYDQFESKSHGSLTVSVDYRF